MYEVKVYVPVKVYEHIKRSNIEDVLLGEYGGFTQYEAKGVYAGEQEYRETTLVYEVVCEDTTCVKIVAEMIKETVMRNQYYGQNR